MDLYFATALVMMNLYLGTTPGILIGTIEAVFVMGMATALTFKRDNKTEILKVPKGLAILIPLFLLLGGVEFAINYTKFVLCVVVALIVDESIAHFVRKVVTAVRKKRDGNHLEQ